MALVNRSRELGRDFCCFNLLSSSISCSRSFTAQSSTKLEIRSKVLPVMKNRHAATCKIFLIPPPCCPYLQESHRKDKATDRRIAPATSRWSGPCTHTLRSVAVASGWSASGYSSESLPAYRVESFVTWDLYEHVGRIRESLPS